MDASTTEPGPENAPESSSPANPTTLKWYQRDWLTTLTPASRKILLASGIIGAVILYSDGLLNQSMVRSNNWTARLPYADAAAVYVPLFNVAENKAPRAKATETARLSSQMLQVRARAHFHLYVMKFFYTRYYAALTLATIMGIIAALCLVHIARVGWANANSYIATTFLVAAGFAIFFKTFPVLYKQEENITANHDLYSKYVALDNELQSYVASGHFRGSDSTSTARVIANVDSTLFVLKDLPIGFDQSKIPDHLKLNLVEKP